MAARIFLFLSITYAILLGGHLYSGDEIMMARVTEAIVTRQDLAVRPIKNFEDYATVEGKDGRRYTWYGLGLSLAAVPFYIAGMFLEDLVSEDGLLAFDGPKVLYYDRKDVSEVVRMYAVSFVNAIVTSLTCATLFALLVRLGLGKKVAALAALTFGLSGVTPFYAKTFFSEPLGGLCLLLAVHLWVASRKGHPLRYASLAGFTSGLSVLTRVANGATLLPFWASVLLEKRPLKYLLVMAASALVPVAIMLAYNAARFSSPFETGYSSVMYLYSGNFLEGLFGLLISPGRGLLLYVPWTIFAFFGLKGLYTRDKPLTVAVFGAFVALLLVYSPWAQWDGGWVFGPRFLVPVLPLLAIPATLFVVEGRHSPVIMVAAGVLVVLSIAIAAQSVEVNFLDYHYAMWRSVTDIDKAMRWSFEWSPLVRYWDFPVRDFILLPRLLRGEGGPALTAFGYALVALWFLATGGLLWGLLRREGLLQPFEDKGPSF